MTTKLQALWKQAIFVTLDTDICKTMYTVNYSNQYKNSKNKIKIQPQ